MIKKVLLLTVDNPRVGELHNAVIRGNFAIHRTLYKKGDGLDKGYTISHKDSGLFLIRCKNLRVAMMMLEYFDTFDIEWETKLSIRTSKDFEKLKEAFALFDVVMQGQVE